MTNESERDVGAAVLDLQTEQHEAGQSCPELYEAVAGLKRRHDLHPCAVRPRDGLSLRRDSERDVVQDLVKRFRDLPISQQRLLPALLNSLGQLEVVVGDLESGQHDFQEVAGLVADPISQAEAHHNVYRAALERRDWNEALAALRRAAALDPDAFEPFPLARYQPLRILGAGGFGVSFLCHDKEANLKVVVRALRPDGLDRGVEAVFRECATIQELDHPALIRIRAFERADAEKTRPYLVTDYFEGETLMDHIAKHGPLAPDDWLAVGWQIGRGLQSLHSRGVLHRNLRPSAVLVRREKHDEGAVRWYVKLLDSGLSLKRDVIHASASNPAARVQTALGRSVARTIAYAPPEVLGKPKGQVWVGPHSDVYALGKLSAFALTGRPDPDADDLVVVPETWKPLLDGLTSWTIGGRLPHLGVVLERMSQLPGADELTSLVEGQMYESTVADHTAALLADPNDFTALVNRGNAYARQGDFDHAIADYSQALALRPEDAAVYRRRGLAYTLTLAHDKAIADFTEAIQREPRHVEAYAHRALAHVQRKEYDAAITDYTEAIRLNPKDEALYYNRGNAHYCKAEYDRAIEDYTEAVRLDPRGAWAFGNRGKANALRGEHAKAVADFSRVLHLDPKNLKALWDRALSYGELGQYDKAVSDYDAAILLEPTAVLFHERGLAKATLGELDQAAADFTAALALDSTNIGALLSRASVHHGRGDYSQALADLNEALILQPDSSVLLSKRGDVQARLGAFAEAADDYTRALELQPDQADVRFNRGNVHIQRGELDKATADFDETLRLDPGNLGALINRGNLHLRRGNIAAALADFDAALAVDPSFAPVYLNRAAAHQEQGDHEGAFADYAEALRLAPDDVTAYHNRGRLYSKLGDYEKAAADNLEVLKRAPDDIRTLNNLAWLWATNPKTEPAKVAEAEEYARKACALTNYQEAGFLDTLAAALAAGGKFTEAVVQQRKAVELAAEAEKADYQSRLALYEAGRPCQGL